MMVQVRRTIINNLKQINKDIKIKYGNNMQHVIYYWEIIVRNLLILLYYLVGKILPVIWRKRIRSIFITKEVIHNMSKMTTIWKFKMMMNDLILYIWYLLIKIY